MHSYQAPLRDMRFVVEELWPELDCSHDIAQATLEQAARFARDILDPLNRHGDEIGCILEGGSVRTPPGFAQAYQAYVDGGWPALACAERYDGTALPQALRVLVEEMITGSNLAFASYTNLIHGAYIALESSANEVLKDRYLPQLSRGHSAATMCLTEADSGSDLSRLKTRAERTDYGTYEISGTKIFVSAGDHDLTRDITHLVLARLPDAPEGTRGISMFLVPKFLSDESKAEANRVFCRSIERKMGQHGAATCVLEFDRARGWLVGKPHSGLRAMFQMMNTVRMGAGLQGLGIAEAAYQRAADYAANRLQGRHIDGARRPELVADPIIEHPDVRRMLLTMRTHVEGMRALMQWVAQALDRSERDATDEAKVRAHDRVALMTPVIKALFTDLGSECANIAVQVLGGHGYIRDNGVEQYVRDVRVAQIYDGTNGIQAQDLVFRKILRQHLATDLTQAIDEYLATDVGNEFAAPLLDVRERFAVATAFLQARAETHRETVAGVACDYLELVGLTALAFMWARAGSIAARKIDGVGAEFYRAKLATAHFFFARILPKSGMLANIVTADEDLLADFDVEDFTRG